MALFREFAEGSGKGRPAAFLQLLENQINEKKIEAIFCFWGLYVFSKK